MRNIAIIPARSGSKGLKNKNIKMLNNKPLIAYSIEAAIDSNLFDEIYVSTDSNEYATIARKYGASVPFLRDSKLATDTSSSWDVVRDAVRNYKRMGEKFDTITLLQPTSPLRNATDIINGFKVFESKEALSVVAVCEVDHSPLWCNVLPSDGSLENFIDNDLVNLPRQELPSYYRINGALYIIDETQLMSGKDIYSSKSYGVIMTKENSIDIDELIDFQIAEVLMTNSSSALY